MFLVKSLSSELVQLVDVSIGDLLLLLVEVSLLLNDEWLGQTLLLLDFWVNLLLDESTISDWGLAWWDVLVSVTLVLPLNLLHELALSLLRAVLNLAGNLVALILGQASSGGVLVDLLDSFKLTVRSQEESEDGKECSIDGKQNEVVDSNSSLDNELWSHCMTHLFEELMEVERVVVVVVPLAMLRVTVFGISELSVLSMASLAFALSVFMKISSFSLRWLVGVLAASTETSL